MDNRYIALLDSGIGGISTLNEMVKIMPNERYIYFGDNLNAPYGNRTVYDLYSRAINNISLIKGYGVKAIILACGTLSSNLLGKIRDREGESVFGVFPPVESTVMKYNKVLLLATQRTAERYQGIKNLTAIGLPNLAKDIERNMFSLERVNVLPHLQNAGVKGRFDAVILGCTHYIFIKNQILDHFCPQFLTDGNHFTAKAVKNFLENKKSSVNYYQNKVLFAGNCSKINKEFCVRSGQKCLNQ